MENKTERATKHKGGARIIVDGRPQQRQGNQRRRHQQELARQQHRAWRRWRRISGLVGALLLLGGSSAYVAFGQGTATHRNASQPGAPIDGVSCQAEMLAYHIHAALRLDWNGHPVILPANIGIPMSAAINQNGQNYCLYALHTHEFDHAAGIIHVESPSPQIYTLGQFFDIWRATARWDAQGGLGASVDASFVKALQRAKPSAIHIYVNGQPHEAGYRNITLTAHKVITVEIGAPLRPPMTQVTFPNGE